MNPAVSVFSIPNDSESTVQLFHLRSTVKNLFLCLHVIIVTDVEVLWNVKKLFIVTVQVSFQLITSFQDKRDIRPGMHEKIRNKLLFSVNLLANKGSFYSPYGSELFLAIHETREVDRLFWTFA